MFYLFPWIPYLFLKIFYWVIGALRVPYSLSWIHDIFPCMFYLDYCVYFVIYFLIYFYCFLCSLFNFISCGVIHLKKLALPFASLSHPLCCTIGPGKIPISPLGKYEFLSVLWCVSWSESWIGPELHNFKPSKFLEENTNVREHCTLPSFAFVSFEGLVVHTGETRICVFSFLICLRSKKYKSFLQHSRDEQKNNYDSCGRMAVVLQPLHLSTCGAVLMTREFPTASPTNMPVSATTKKISVGNSTYFSYSDCQKLHVCTLFRFFFYLVCGSKIREIDHILIPSEVICLLCSMVPKALCPFCRGCCCVKVASNFFSHMAACKISEHLIK